MPNVIENEMTNSITMTVPLKFIFIGLLFLFPIFSFGQWKLISNQDTLIWYYDVATTPDSTVFVCGYSNNSGIILKSQNYGNSWDTTTFINGYGCYDISFPTNVIGYVKQSPGNLYKTIDGGNSWNLINDSVWASPSGDLLFINPDTGFSSYQDGGAGFYRTIDGGFTWNQIIDTNLTGGQQYIGGREMIFNNGKLYNTGGNFYMKSLDYGVHWQTITNDSVYNSNYAISVFNDTVWIAGYTNSYPPLLNFGIVSRTTDGGLTWNIWDNQQIYLFQDMKMISNLEGYLVNFFYDSTYAFMKTIDGGISWCRQQWTGNNQYFFHLNSIDCINDSICFAVGNNGTIFRTLNGGGQLLDLYTHKDVTYFNIYPNPFSNYATLEFNYLGNKKYVLNIYNDMGQRITEINDITSGQIRIDRNDFKSGFYIFELRDENIILGTRKLIIE